MYQKIQNPETNRMVSIYGRIGKKILQNYLQYVTYGGASLAEPAEDGSHTYDTHNAVATEQEKTNKDQDHTEDEDEDEDHPEPNEDPETEGFSILELQTFLNNLDLTDEYVKDIYDSFISEIGDPLEVTNIHLAYAKQNWNKGTYYLGGQLPMDVHDKITQATIQQVKDLYTERLRTYGGPTNGSEAASIHRYEQELKVIENFIDVYHHLQEHKKYKPGGKGAYVAEQEFNAFSSLHAHRKLNNP